MRGSGAIRDRALALGLMALAAGCAHRAGPGPKPGDERPGGWTLPAAELGTQRLFRVRIQGPEGAAALRLVLRLAENDRFQALASDSFGRAAWSLDLTASGITVLDHRRRTFCFSSRATGSPEPALAPVPAEWLPAVLLGYLPSVPASLAPPFNGRIEFTDRDGRRWAASFADGSLEAWTLSGDRGPVVWWTRRGDEGILSQREGLQFRWRETLREPLAAEPAPVDIPSDYQRRSCDEPDLSELRQDQSPP